MKTSDLFNMNAKQPSLSDGVFGFAVADAIGVPYEFKTRTEMIKNPCTDMIGFGTWNQKPGTWSDDTSMTLCLASSLKQKKGEVDLEDIMNRIVKWYTQAKYTAHNEVFDVGNTTREAIENFMGNKDVYSCGADQVQSNGNGALMRVLPLAFYNITVQDVWHVSGLTHRHDISRIGCVIYVFTAKALIAGNPIQNGIENAFSYLMQFGYLHDLCQHYGRIPYIHELDVEQIKSTGYVVDTLEAALWCLQTTDNYKECILKAVNLGGDTDTVAAVAGGLAGIKYGIKEIPEGWLDQLQNKELIQKVCCK